MELGDFVFVVDIFSPSSQVCFYVESVDSVHHPYTLWSIQSLPFPSFDLRDEVPGLFSCEWVQEITRVLKHVLIEEMRTPVPASPVRTPVFLSPRNWPVEAQRGSHWDAGLGPGAPGTEVGPQVLWLQEAWVLLGMLHLPHKQLGGSPWYECCHTLHTSPEPRQMFWEKKHEADLGGGSPSSLWNVDPFQQPFSATGGFSPLFWMTWKDMVWMKVFKHYFSPTGSLQSDSLPERAKIDI